MTTTIAGQRGDLLRTEYRDSGETETVAVQSGTTHWSEPRAWVHRVVNVGDTPYEKAVVFFLSEPEMEPEAKWDVTIQLVEMGNHTDLLAQRGRDCDLYTMQWAAQAEGEGNGRVDGLVVWHNSMLVSVTRIVLMNPLDLFKLAALMERTSSSPEVKIGLIDGPVVTRHPALEGCTTNLLVCDSHACAWRHW